jgi:hypothetical protein
MKKTLLLSFLTILTLGSFAQQTGVWISQATGFVPVSSGVRNVSVVDTNIVWVSSYDGSGVNLPRQDYSRTNDGGQTWHVGTIPTQVNWDWSMLYALSDSTAWGVFFNSTFSHSGQIWKTTNAGQNWVQQGAGAIYTSTTESFPNDIHFWNDSVGCVIGDPLTINGKQYFEIYTTTNGGTTWTLADTTNLRALNTNEANQITHVTTVGDTIWFDSNFGRVFRSVNRGLNWTVSNTNLINFEGIIDIAFYNHLSGIARYYNDTLAQNTVVETSDGGSTWTSFALNDTIFGGDLKAVPGVDSMLVSTGISPNFNNFWGTSYSLNGGHNWTVVETNNQRGNLGIADSLTMWCGGFTSSSASGGIFKWTIIDVVSCNDVNVNSGTLTIDTIAICDGDTATLTTTGIFAPTNGAFFGFGYAISTSDISGSLDPNSELSIIGSTRIISPAVATNELLQINDASFFGSATGPPYGLYYFTPVAFGNATAATTPPIQFLSDVNFDPNCTFTGTSVAIDIQDPGLPPCSPVGIKELYSKVLSISSSLRDRNTLDVKINSAKTGKVTVQILDITGRSIRTIESNVKEGSSHEFINVENLSQGTYLVKAEMNGIKSTTKVVKY